MQNYIFGVSWAVLILENNSSALCVVWSEPSFRGCETKRRVARMQTTWTPSRNGYVTARTTAPVYKPNWTGSNKFPVLKKKKK